MRENVFTETFRLTPEGEKEWNKFNNPGFVPGLLITQQDMEKLKIPLVEGCEEYRILRAKNGVWVLMGKFGNEYKNLTSVAIFKMEKLFGDYFEEEYYERIFS